MSRHDRIPSQLRHLAAPARSDEVAEQRWMRLWQHGIAEIDVQRVECAALREKVIRECKKQNAR